MSIDYSRVYTAFESSMRALYTLNERIVKITEDEELSSLREFYFDILKFFPDFVDEEEIVEILSRFIKIDEEDDILRPKEILEQLGERIPEEYFFEDGTGFNTKLFIAEMLEWQKIDSESFSCFLRAVYKMTRDAPIKTELLRRGILLSVISIFDDFLTKLVANADLPSLDVWWNTRIKEDKGFTGIEKKVLFFSENLDIAFLDEFIVSQIVEITARRNTFTHHNGLVDEIYLKTAKQYANAKGLKLGERLRLSKNYMQRALEIIYLSGIILTQTLWRKASDETESLDEADKKIILSQKLALQDERFVVAKMISQWGYSVMRSDNSLLPKQIKTDDGYKLRRRRYVFLINYAMALHMLGDVRGMKKILQKIKHPEWSYSVRAAIAVMEEKHKLALQYLEDGVRQEQAIHDLFLDDSPVFQLLADYPDYAKIRDLAKKNLA